MPDKMPAQFPFRFLPSPEWLGCGRQAGIQPEIVEQPIHAQLQQIMLIQFHGVLERAFQQPHVLQRKRLNFQWNNRLHLQFPIVARQRIGVGWDRQQKDYGREGTANLAERGGESSRGLQSTDTAASEDRVAERRLKRQRCQVVQPSLSYGDMCGRVVRGLKSTATLTSSLSDALPPQ